MNALTTAYEIEMRIATLLVCCLLVSISSNAFASKLKALKKPPPFKPHPGLLKIIKENVKFKGCKDIFKYENPKDRPKAPSSKYMKRRPK